MKSVLSLNPIVIKGNLLYDSVTQERFYIKGVTYDPIPTCINGASDVLADDYPEHEWVYGQEWVNWRSDLEDIALMNVNVIRVYQIDPHKTHTQFMEKAESLGLYVSAPLTGSNFGKLDAQVPSPTCYSDTLGSELLWFASTVIAQFSQFNNMLMFMSANELYLWSNNAHSFPCLKALVRDLHEWQTSCGQTMRRVPLAYAMQDIGSPHRESIAAYLTSVKESEDDALDIFGLNSYVYCQIWPWDAQSPLFQLNEVYKNYAVPFVVTEFGCQTNGLETRTWSQIPQMMTDMQETLSGGFVYEYSQHLKPWDQTGFGLVETSASTCDSTTERTWYSNAYPLQEKYSMNPWQQYDNFKGSWTDSDRCTWKPPTVLEHTQPDFPDVNNMDSGVQWDYSNWNDLLPPKPLVNPVVTCPSSQLSELELKENSCFSSVVITIDAPSRDPSLQPTTWNPSAMPLAPSPNPTSSPFPKPTLRPLPAPSSNPSNMPTHSPDTQPAVLVQISNEAGIGKENGGTNKAKPSRTNSQGDPKVIGAEVSLYCILFVLLVAAGLYMAREQRRRKNITHEIDMAARPAAIELCDRLGSGNLSNAKNNHDQSDVINVTANPFHEGGLEGENIPTEVSSTTVAGSDVDLPQHAVAGDSDDGGSEKEDDDGLKCTLAEIFEGEADLFDMLNNLLDSPESPAEVSTQAPTQSPADGSSSLV